jgi:hypothetical protein
MMRIALAIGIGLVFASCAALAQQSIPGTATGQPPGPLGGYRGASNNPGSGDGEMPGSFAGVADRYAEGMVKGQYGIDLSRRIADARRLVDAVAGGRVLTDSNTRHIRDSMREDFFAWRNQFDIMPAAFRAERDRWLVDEKALSPNAWAKQRLNWLEAQRDWILSHGG